MTGNVHDIRSGQSPPTADPGGGGGGNGVDGRLRALEIQIARIDERVASMQENMAKKNDVTALKVWILGGVLSAIAVAAAVSAAVVKAFF